MCTLANNFGHNLRIFGVSGDSIEKQEEFYSNQFCSNICGFFQKPINFPNLFSKMKQLM